MTEKPGPQFKRGDRVEHSVYGRGKVKSISWGLVQGEWIYDVRMDRGPTRADTGERIEGRHTGLCEYDMHLVGAVDQLSELL